MIVRWLESRYRARRGRPSREGGLGTFGGVFTPSILTILGVIMYLRLGWVVGTVGLGATILIITLSTSITFLTALSIATIATDRRVRIGGAYYMISRCLGVESGGAIGLPLYMAIALSVALYTTGFAESFAAVFPGLSPRVVAVVVTLGVAALGLSSVTLVIRVQYVIMGAIALSLVSLLLGRSLAAAPGAIPVGEPAAGLGFWAVFAVFFPAVTGIMAGVNMSGDLRDPARSIPAGTLAAVGVGYLIYVGLAVLLALRADPVSLTVDPLIMRRLAFWGDAILVGVWGATLSSAVGSVLAAPRVLQALARDGVLTERGRWMGRGSGPGQEPRVGTVVTLVIVLVAVLLGDLDAIAPVLTMFFLTTYLVLNLAAGIEGIVESPSFRPAFRVHWVLSLLGAAACLGVMFMINPVASIVAAAVVLAVYLWLEQRGLRATWGDVRAGVWLMFLRSALLRMGSMSAEEWCTWRPNPLVLSGAPTRRWHLIDLANSLTQGRGLVTVASVLPEESRDPKRLETLERTIQDFLTRRGVQALVRLVSAEDPFRGSRHLVESYGMGGFRPNTIILGDSEQASVREGYCRMVDSFHRAGRNVVIVRDDGSNFGARKRIDVWWGGMQANGALMLLLSHLLTRSVEWNDARIRVKLVVSEEAARAQAEGNLTRILEQTRVDATGEVLLSGARSFKAVLGESSSRADLVMLGMAEPGADFNAYYGRLQHLADGLPTVVFVLASQDLPFKQILR